MADNTINYVIKLLGGEAIFSNLSKLSFGFNNIADAVGRVTGRMQEFVEANKMQQEAENKLAQVMRNTMGASMAEIDSIKQLASAQQELGVIGDEVQLAGAQELGTYLTKSETLKKLMPVMNDMVAQQYGLNASQESAVGIATMMGKVMDGQVGALSRYGYKFDEAQEKILKFGTEEERAAVLTDVISNSVGGMNEALANTPEGKVQQAANSFGDLKEKIGLVWTKIQVALLPMFEKIRGKLDDIVGWLDDHADDIANFVDNVVPIILSVATAVGAVVAVIKIVTTVTRIWTTVQMVLNAILTANPIGLIIAGVVLLIGVIVFLSLKIKGWGTLWDAVWTFAKETFMAHVDAIKLYFTTMVNGIMMGIDKLKEGWYKFKLAVGIGDENENMKALEAVQNDIRARADVIAAAAKKEKDHIEKAKHAFDKVSLQWDKKVTLKSTTDKLKAELGMTGEVNETTVNNDLSDASTSISAGGKNVKNFNITINDGLVNGVQNYFNSSSDDPSSASDFMWRLSNALQMILNDVNYAAQ